MAKGAFLTHEVKVMISEIHIAHPGYGPTALREELLKRMKDTGLSRNFDKGWPSLSAVGVEYHRIKERENNRPPEIKDIDNPWSTASLPKYPMNPEALTVVLKLWVWLREDKNLSLTIREAQWAARFSAITKDMYLLSVMARAQAFTEVICELIGIPDSPCHTSDLGLFEFMTGEKITPDRIKKILDWSDEELRMYQEAGEALENEDYTSLPDSTPVIENALKYMRKARKANKIKEAKK